MINKYIYKNLTWIDIESPTNEDVRNIMGQYGVHPLVGEELLSPTIRPKVDVYKNHIYLIMHFPSVSSDYNKDGGSGQEIDFIIGKDFIITVHYQLIDSLNEFSKVFEVNSILDKSGVGDHAGYILFYMLRELYKNLEKNLDDIDNRLEDVERKIFEGKESKMVKVLSHINRDLLNIRQAIRPHKDVLQSFEISGAQFFTSDFKYHLRTLTGEYYKVFNILEGHKETLLDLRETNDSLLTTKTNDIMKMFTVMAFVVFPPALFVALFSMNTVNTPLVGYENDFWVIVMLMFISTIITFIYFKWKKWI